MIWFWKGGDRKMAIAAPTFLPPTDFFAHTLPHTLHLHTQKGNLVPPMSCDITQRAQVGPISYFNFTMRVIIKDLYLFVNQIGNLNYMAKKSMIKLLFRSPRRVSRSLVRGTFDPKAPIKFGAIARTTHWNVINSCFCSKKIVLLTMVNMTIWSPGSQGTSTYLGVHL